MMRVLVTLLLTLGGCSANPWAKGFAPRDGQTIYAPTGGATLELVDYEEAIAARPEADHATIGYANFTAEFSSASEDALRKFAMQIGADRVVWGLRLLHTERHSSLQPVTEWSDTRVRGRAYNPVSGEYDGEPVRVDATTTTTRYEPVIDDRAYDAYRAVFYRSPNPPPAR